MKIEGNQTFSSMEIVRENIIIILANKCEQIKALLCPKSIYHNRSSPNFSKHLEKTSDISQLLLKDSNYNY